MSEEEIKQKAEEWVKHSSDESIHSFIGEQLQKAYIAGSTENGTQWHDLRKDPNDLPDTDRFVYVQTMNDTGKAYYDKGWYSSQISGIVIAWCEEPRFKE